MRNEKCKIKFKSANAKISACFLFRSEAGKNSLRKTKWLLKHTATTKLTPFKTEQNINQLSEQLREKIISKYCAKDRLALINFVSGSKDLTAAKQIEKVSKDWFAETKI